MKKTDIKGLFSQAAEKIRSLDDTEEIPFLDQDLKPKKKKKKKRKHRKKSRRVPFSAITGIILAVLLGAEITGLYIYKNLIGQEISILDSSVISFTGYNGKGAVKEGFAPEEKALNILLEDAEELETQGKDASDIYHLIDSIACGFSKSEQLSNGDTITYACSYSAEYAKAAHYKLVNTQASYKVKDLADLAELDPFENVSADWVLQNTGTTITFTIPELQNSLGITYRWSYGTENNTYNGHSIFAEADYSSEVLAASGYVIESDTKEFEMGSMPEIITSIDDLSYEEKSQLITQMTSVLESELAACGQQYTVNGNTVSVTGHSSGYLSQDCDTVWYEPDTAFTITYDLQVSGQSGSIWNRISSYSISYSGTIYRLSDGSVQFNNESSHGCFFGGYIGIYHVAEENESSEIFGTITDTFNNITENIFPQEEENDLPEDSMEQNDGPPQSHENSSPYN